MDAHEILKKGAELQAARHAALEPLAEVLAERLRLEKTLAEIEPAYAKAYVTAEAGGWSVEEPASLGAGEPAKRPRRKPKAGSKSPSPSGPAPTEIPGQAPVGANA